MITDFKKRIIFGAGFLGVEALRKYNNEVDYFVDNDIAKHGKFIRSKRVYPPEVLLKEDREKLVIFVTASFFCEIAEQLKSMGFEEGRDFISTDDPSEDVLATKEIRGVRIELTSFCNSKCIMCRVWCKQNKKHLAVDEFCDILKQDAFQTVQEIAISGGEPTLVPSLELYFKKAIDILPNLKSISINTNGLNSNKIADLFKDIQKICDEGNIGFLPVVSLDGIGPIHDQNRGVHGAFDKTMETITLLQKEKINIWVATCITSINIFNLEALYSLLNAKNINGCLKKR